jgi:2-polyprenyl-3-methyl-5-hydroxy-6-metoxy-1,4-benzoquinol methylase
METIDGVVDASTAVSLNPPRVTYVSELNVSRSPSASGTLAPSEERLAIFFVVRQAHSVGSENAEIHAHYAQGKEWDRLGDAKGAIEFERTKEILGRRLPPAPAVIADIGGGPGRYSLWLAELGYTVEHRDLVRLHVEQLQASSWSTVHAEVGDARDLNLLDASVDAVVLLARSTTFGNDPTESRRSVKPVASSDLAAQSLLQ